MFLRAALAEKKIEFDFVTVNAPTRQCVTVIDEAKGTHTELVEEEKVSKGVRREQHGFHRQNHCAERSQGWCLVSNQKSEGEMMVGIFK